MLEIS